MTPARRRAFSSEHPTRQRFTKTDLANSRTPGTSCRTWSAWAQEELLRLHDPAGGAGPDGRRPGPFRTAHRQGNPLPDHREIVQRQNFGGYRANIVTYTIALLSHATGQRVNLDRIWREQALSENLQVAIAELSHEVHRIITNPPRSRNITEWCKSERCWADVRDSASGIP